MLNIFLKFFYYFNGRLNRILTLKSNFYVNIDKNSYVKIGKNFSSRSGCKFFVKKGGKLIIGDNVFFNHNTYIYCNNEVIIGNNTIFGPNTYIFDHNHKISSSGPLRNELNLKKVSIGQNVWVGASCNLLAGTRVEDNSIISANSTVKSHIPPKTIYSLDKHFYKITKII